MIIALVLFFSFNTYASSDVQEHKSSRSQPGGQLTPESHFREINNKDYEAARRKQVSPTPFSSPHGPQPESQSEQRARLAALSNLDLTAAAIENNRPVAQAQIVSRMHVCGGVAATSGILYATYKLSSTVQERTNRSLKKARTALKKFWKKRQNTPVTVGFLFKSGIAVGLLYKLLQRYPI